MSRPPRAPNVLALALFLFLSAAIAASSTAQRNPCKPICHPWRKWDKRTCPWKYCTHISCSYRAPSGRWRKGQRCVRRKSVPFAPKPKQKPIPKPLCESKCYVKWLAARRSCYLMRCRLRGCQIWIAGRRRWGFRCVPKLARLSPSPSPSPSPSSSPRSVYPPYCPPKCRLLRGAAVARCNPARCHIVSCTQRWGRWRYGFRCVRKPPALPSPKPKPLPSTATDKPFPPFCIVQCRRRWRDAKRDCNPAICKMGNCYHPWSWWKWGFRCVPKAGLPTVTPTTKATFTTRPLTTIVPTKKAATTTIPPMTAEQTMMRTTTTRIAMTTSILATTATMTETTANIITRTTTEIATTSMATTTNMKPLTVASTTDVVPTTTYSTTTSSATMTKASMTRKQQGKKCKERCQKTYERAAKNCDLASCKVVSCGKKGDRFNCIQL